MIGVLLDYASYACYRTAVEKQEKLLPQTKPSLFTSYVTITLNLFYGFERTMMLFISSDRGIWFTETHSSHHILCNKLLHALLWVRVPFSFLCHYTDDIKGEALMSHDPTDPQWGFRSVCKAPSRQAGAPPEGKPMCQFPFFWTRDKKMISWSYLLHIQLTCYLWKKNIVITCTFRSSAIRY